MTDVTGHAHAAGHMTFGYKRGAAHELGVHSLETLKQLEHSKHAG